MKTPSIKKNFIMNALLSMSSFIFPLITFPYVSRVLLPDGMGKVQFVTSFVAYFNIIAQLGIPTYGIRACAKVRENREELTRTVHELLLLNLLMCLLAYVGLGLSIACIPRVRQEKTLALIIGLTLLLNALGMEWLYKALEQYTYITVRSVLFKLIAMAAMFLLVHSQEDYVVYGAITIFAASASNLLNFINARRFLSFRPVGGYDLRRHTRAVLVFFAMACATTVYTNLDEVMLGFMKTNADVGYYHAAVKIKTILVSLVTALGAVLLPRASYYMEQGMKEAFKRITEKALHFVLLAASAVMVYFMLFARAGILLLSGSAFEPAVVPMQIIMPTVLLIGITNVLGIQILVPLGKEVKVLYSEIAGALVDLVLNLLLIPRYGAAGAAVGTLAAEAAVLLVQYCALRDMAAGLFRSFRYRNALLALALAMVTSVWVLFCPFGSFLTLLISACCFFGVYAVVLLWTKEPLMMELFEQMKAIVRNRLGKKEA